MNNKKIIFSILSLIMIAGSIIFAYKTVTKADAAITDCTAVSGNLISNCSFEDESVLPPGYVTSILDGNYPVLTSGYTGLTDWSIITPGTGNVVLVNNAAGNVPQGDRVVDVSGVIDSSGLQGEIFGTGIEQVVTGLVSGQTYTLKFSQSHLSASGIDFPSQVEVVVDGASKGIFSHNPSTISETIGLFAWTENTVTFTATSGSATIGFYNNSPTPAPSNGPGRPVALIDNVILTTDSDTTIPSVIISTNAISPVSGIFTVTATFSEPVSGFTLVSGDISVVNGTFSNLSAPVTNLDGTQTYTFDITPTVDGDMTDITVNASAAVDGGNNPNTVSNTLSVLYDFTSPIISSVHIQSNNTQPTYATTGNTITLSYTLDDGATPVQKQTVIIAGVTVVPVCVPSVGLPGGGDCTATLVVPAGAPVSEGLVSFSVSVDAGPGQLIEITTDGSFVIIDRIPPVVTITSPIPGSVVTGPFNLTGTCESGLDVVITAGGPPSNYKPDVTNQITTSCVGGVYSVALSPIGAIGTSVLIALIEQVDVAGNHSAPIDATYPIGAVPSTRVISITGPTGIAVLGPNVVTGVCDMGPIVTITGTGFDSPGTVPCVDGAYSFPIVITGNTTINACQQYSDGGDREMIITNNCATTSTTLPSVVVSPSGNPSSIGVTSGGCIYGVNGCGNGINPFTNSSYQVPASTNTITTLTCPVFSQYLKQGNRDGVGGIFEVSKVQKFLNRQLGKGILEDGVFGIQTKKAVKDFQAAHFTEILSPWMLSGPTGWWYQSTRSYANYLESCTEGIVRLDNAVKIQNGKIVN